MNYSNNINLTNILVFSVAIGIGIAGVNYVDNNFSNQTKHNMKFVGMCLFMGTMVESVRYIGSFEKADVIADPIPVYIVKPAHFNF